MIDQRLYCCLHFSAPNAGQKTQAAKIYSHDRHVVTANKRNRVKQCAVPAKTDNRFNFVCDLFRRLKCFSASRQRNPVLYFLAERMENDWLKVLFIQFIEKQLYILPLFFLPYTTVNGYFHGCFSEIILPV